MCDRNPRDNLKRVKKNGSQDRIPSQWLCFAAPALPNFVAALQLLCGMRLVASLARVLSPDSSHGNKSHSMGNTRICLKRNWALSNARYAPETSRKRFWNMKNTHHTLLPINLSTLISIRDPCLELKPLQNEVAERQVNNLCRSLDHQEESFCFVLLDFAWIHSLELS